MLNKINWLIAVVGVSTFAIAASPASASLMTGNFETDIGLSNSQSIIVSPKFPDEQGAKGSSVTLNFWENNAHDIQGSYKDSIRIFSVPLPPAILLFGVALLGIGWLGRRRKKASTEFD